MTKKHSELAYSCGALYCATFKNTPNKYPRTSTQSYFVTASVMILPMSSTLHSHSKGTKCPNITSTNIILD